MPAFPQIDVLAQRLTECAVSGYAKGRNDKGLAPGNALWSEAFSRREWVLR
jgi:hypothetical protein